MKIHYFLALFLLTIFTSNYNFTSAQTNLLCTFVNLDCNNDGIVDSVLNGGVPLVISNPTSSFNYTTTNIPCDSSGLSGIPVGNYTVSIDSNWLNANGYTVNNITPNSISTFLPAPTTITILLNCAQPPSKMCLLGQVYCDVDSSGTFTLGDIPLDSVPLILNSSQGQLSALSNLTGNYNFTYPGTAGQNSTVSIDSAWLAANGFSTNINPVSFNDSACLNTPIGLPGLNIIDFPILGCSTSPPQIDMCISGVIYCDIDSNGVFSMGDIPIDSVPVTVITPQGTILNTFTDVNGLYSFTYQGTVGLPSIVNIDPIWLATNGYSGNPVSNAINTPCLLGGVVIDLSLIHI